MALRPTGNVAKASLAVGARRQTGEVGLGVPALSTTAMFTNAHDLQIMNSNLSVAGGDINNQVHNHYHYAGKKDIWAILHSVPNFRNIYHDMLEKATTGTGTWLVTGDKFRIWLESNGDIKIFWGSGIPGAGKTVLASIVIQYLEAMRNELGGAICVCYFYFRYSQREEVTVRNVLETLVKQTVERHPDCQALVERAYAQHLKEGSEPTVTQLLGLLQELANCMVCTFYVLDALDEAPTKIQLVVVKTLAALNVKLFITSRPLETVQAKFPQAHITTIMAQDADLDLHIAKAIDESADLQYLLDQEDSSLQVEIVSTIKQNCGGMFLHASLQLDALRECISAQQVRRTLKAFPSKIEDVYLYTWDRILKQNPEHVSLAKAVLLWVLNASRSMTVKELGRAVSTSPDTHKFEADRVVPSATLVSLCRGLVTVEDESHLVRLVHYTAKDTLQGLIREWFPHPHSLLAAVCMTHLAECGFQDTTISSYAEFIIALDEDPLLAYAAEAWTSHAYAGLDSEETKNRTAEFIKESHAFPAFSPWTFDILTPLHIVGLYKLPIALISGAQLSSPNSTTKFLQQTPLTVASQSGHEDLVVRLIALPETRVNWQDHLGDSALILAAYYGHEGVVKLLLAYPGIQVNLADKEGWSALMSAAYKGLEGVLKLLLVHPEIQVNLVNNNGSSALILAASENREGAVRILLGYPGIQVNLANNHGSTALLLAAEFGHNAVVKLLLATGAFDVNGFDNDGDTAIKMAAGRGHEAIVRTLLDTPNVDITIRSTEDGHSTMSAAQANGHSVIVGLLREFEARRTVTMTPPEIAQLSLLRRTDEEGSDAEDGEEEEGS